MTEQEYIDLKNLTNLRVAHALLGECLFTEPKDHCNIANISGELHVMITELYNKLEVL